MDTASYLGNQKSKRKQPWTRGLWGILAGWIHILEMVVNMSSTVIGQILHFCLDICKNERSQTNAIHLRCRYSKTSEFGSLCNKCQFTTKPKIAFEQQTGFDQTETLCPYSFVSPRYMCSKNQEFIYNISDFPSDPLGGRKASPTRGWYKSREMWTQTNAYVAWPKTVCYRTRSYITPVIPALVHHRSRHVPTPGIWISKEKNLDDSD